MFRYVGSAEHLRDTKKTRAALKETKEHGVGEGIMNLVELLRRGT